MMLFYSIAENAKVPDSFCFFIIKMLPKINSLCSVDKFRQTDLKSFSYVLASRLKKETPLCLPPKPQLITAISLVRLAKEKLDRSNCMISIDFSKAFDRLGRKNFLKFLNEIGCPFILTKTIESLYCESKTLLQVIDQLSKFIQNENVIKQGCPLSALLFILGIELLLQAICRNTKIKTNQT